VVTGLTFGAKTLTLDGTADASLMNSINGVVEGPATITLVKNGTSSWAITGAGTHSGLTTVNGGVLRISNSTALGAVTAGTVVADGATLQLEGGIAVGAEALTISGTGAAGQTGALVNRSGSNSFAGAITALSPLTISSEAGALTLGALTGADFGLTVGGAGDLSFGGDVLLGTGAITKNGAGLLALVGNNSFTGGVALNAGTVEAGSAGALGTTGSITFGGGALRHGAGNTVDYSARFVSAPGTAYKIATAGQSVTYASPLSGVGSTLTKSGSGTLVLSAVNTFDGQTAVTGGVLSILSEENLGAAPAAFVADQLLLDNGTLLSTASFAINDANRGITLGALGGTFNTAPSTQLTLGTALTGAGQLTKDGAGTLLLNVVSTHAGGTVVQDGKLLLGVNNAISGAVTVSGAGALDIGVNNLTVSSLNVTGSSASIAGTGSIDSASGFGFSPTGTATISSVLAGPGGVTMSGTGTVSLKGANTYTGPTTISSGALLLDGGSIASTGTVSVASAATFGGIGSVAGPVVLAAGTGYQAGEQSLLNVGGGVRDGLNVLDLNGDLTMGAFSIIDFYLTRTGFTQLDVAGLLNLDATTRIRINLDSGYIPSVGSEFDLLNWVGAPTIGGGLTLVDLLFPLPTDGMGSPVWLTSAFNSDGILRVDGLRTGPAITTDPVGGVVLAGDSVTFTLGVTGSDPLVIQWYKGPTTANPIAGAKGLTYTIPAAAGADSGQYWARVTNGPNPEDTVDSQLATLDVVTLPRITAQPTGATLFPSPGTNKTFNVTAIGPGTLTYVWKKATVAIPGAPNDDEYTINGVQVADSGNYTVTVSNGFGSVTSDVAVLTVSQAIAFTQQPLTPVPAVPEGNPVTLTAAVTGDGPFTYQWERAPRIGLTGSNFGPFAPVSGQTAPTITQTLDLTNQGKYRLVVSNAYTTLTSNEATVIFGAAQVVVTTQPISKVVAVGSTLELDVVTSGGKPQKFQWFFKGKAVGDETDSTLRIEDVTSARAGPYFCRISNSLVSGSTQVDTATVYVSVVDRKPGRFVLTQPGTVSLSVTATADKADPLTYQWFVDDGLVSAPNVQPVAGATLRTLKVTNLTAGRKRFFCRVSGGGGSRFLDGGDNLVFIYTQPPALQPEGSWNLPDTVVSQPYSYQVPMVDNPLEAGQPNPLSMPVSFKAVGLPPGLTINSAGLISGRATVERRDKVTKLVIPYTVTITATNKLGTTTPIIKNLVVNPLDVGLIGAFTGPIDRNSSLNGNLGGMINFTTTKTGSYSGSLTMGAKAYPFKGNLNSAISDPTNPSVTVKVSRGTTLRPLLVSFKLNSAGFVTGPVNPLTRGTITDGRTIAQFDGWRNTWLATSTNKTPALAYSGYYTMGLDIPLPLQGTTTNPSIPQGTGYASFTVSSTTGKLTVSGKLADGTAFTTATYVGPTGEVLVYRALYGTTATSTRGSVLGKLQIDQVVALDTTDNTLDGTVSWWKVAQPVSTSTAGRTYAAGFGPFDLSVLGSRYLPPLKGFPVLGLAQNATTNNARLNLVEANSEASLPVMTGSPANTVAVRVDNASKVFPDVLNNPRKVSMTITPATGLVSFKFSLSQPHPFNGSPATVARAVSGVGMIVRNGTEQQAWGYFMLPQLPSSFSEKTTATPILSGQAVFEKIP
jgi:autotransporter-associated beta strand protein